MPTQRKVTGKGQVAARTGLGSALWQALVSPRFTLALFLALIFLALLGTLFAQSGTSLVALEKIYDPEVLYFLKVAGLTDIFHSIWFIFILTLIGLNQFCVLIDRIPRAWNDAVRPSPAAIQSEQVWKKPVNGIAAEIATEISREKFRELIHKWCKGRLSKPRAIRDEGGLTELQLSAQEGRFSRFTVLFAHLGLLVLIAGGVIEGLGGFEGQLTLDEGDRVNYIQILRGNSQKWPVLNKMGHEIAGFFEPGFEIELTHFNPSFYPGTQQPQQLTSSVSFYQGGKSVAQREVRVNEPVLFKGLRFFQGAFSRTAQTKLSLKISSTEGLEKEERAYPALLQGQKYDLEGASFHIDEIQETEAMGFSFHVEYKEDHGEVQHFWIFQKFPQYDEVHRRKSRYHFSMPKEGLPVEPRYTATLKIGRNPGLAWIFAGALIFVFGLLASTLFSANSFRFVWKAGKVRVFGESQRPSLFEPEFLRSAQQIRRELSRSGAVGELEVRHGTH